MRHCVCQGGGRHSKHPHLNDDWWGRGGGCSGDGGGWKVVGCVWRTRWRLWMGGNNVELFISAETGVSFCGRDARVLIWWSRVECSSEASNILSSCWGCEMFTQLEVTFKLKPFVFVVGQKKEVNSQGSRPPPHCCLFHFLFPVLLWTHTCHLRLVF